MPASLAAFAQRGIVNLRAMADQLVFGSRPLSRAVEAVVAVLTCHHGVVPPTINYETPDPACDLDYVPNEARVAAVRRAMSTSVGLGGHNSAIIFGKWEGA